MKKIAICFSGQPRTWEKCADTWLDLFNAIKETYNVSVDVFAHAWDFNTSSHGLIAHNPINFLHYNGMKIDDNEKDRYTKILQPKAFLFEDETRSLSAIYETLNLGQRQQDVHGLPAISWAASQFYSVMRSAHLKKKYEYEHGVRYDMCIRIRNDLYFDENQIECFLKDLTTPVYNTVYPCHTSRDDHSFPFIRMGDILWFADSITFDRICDFYRWFPILGKRSFNVQEPGTEHTLYYYTKMLRMSVNPISVDPKIYRESDYLEKKHALGFGGLGDHELI